MLKIALPNKGRLADDTRTLLADAGLEVRSVGSRALTGAIGEEFRALFVRSQDIPELVSDGAADVGVTGWDLVLESGRGLDRVLDLGFGRCRLVVAVRDESPVRTITELPPGTRVATSFPRTASQGLAKRGVQVELVQVSGATEAAPHLGIADAIVDLTSSGHTLRVNGMREIETLLESSACMVVATSARERLGSQLRELSDALESVLRARDRRYLMANVPRSALNAVRSIIPGLNGPTITDIMNEGSHVAVHAVVAAAGIYRTIASLKSLGAEGILVTRIERLMP